MNRIIVISFFNRTIVFSCQGEVEVTSQTNYRLFSYESYHEV